MFQQLKIHLQQLNKAMATTTWTHMSEVEPVFIFCLKNEDYRGGKQAKANWSLNATGMNEVWKQKKS